MGNIIANAREVTPDWLTPRLRQHQALLQGYVDNVTVSESRTSFASVISRIEVSYSQDATPGAPQKLFLKISNPALAPGEYDPEELHKEYTFYHKIAPLMALPFTIPCYDAAFDPETGASYILLKDVSGTHIACPTPPNMQNREQAIDCLARLHAFWWDHPLLGQEVGRFPSREERRQEWADAEKSTTAFLSALGDRLPQSWRAVYERVLPALPNLFARHASGQNLTLAHGDAHLGNFLFPKDPLGEGIFLLDWQFWHPTIGGTDLAFMMAAEWEIETRRSLEQALLHRYHDRLLEHGVQGYSWKECWNDYRLSVVLVSIFIPVWRWALFHWELDWIAVERSMTAFEDLDCFDLLG